VSEKYFTVVYVLKDGQTPADILKDKEFKEDYVFASLGDCTIQDEDEDEY
jgi:hypothetical protein